jgi:CDP-diacylglycerol--serine O-phosphatidyltransferase
MGIKMLPNVFTGMNLLLGVVALAFIMHQYYLLSSGLIVTAAIMDRFDGILARRLEADSKFGKELDSLADLVSFGVAPALLAYTVSLQGWAVAGLALIGLYVLCGAYRLARFNVIESRDCFLGLPITAAGVLLAVVLALTASPVVVAIICLGLSAAMISSVPVPKI